MSIKVAIVDDKQELIDSLVQNLEFYEDVKILFTAESGAEALHELKKKTPDLILMDIEMPGMDGIDLTRRVTSDYSTVKVVMLTVFDQDDKVFEAILAGACGYLLKDEKPKKIIASIEEAVNGGAPMSPRIASKTLNFIRSREEVMESNLESPDDYKLTAREVEILKELSGGIGYMEIAEKLFISPSTVRKHIENIYGKLHIHSKVDAVKIGMKNRWFS